SGPDDAPVVMLGHSLGSSLSMWDPQVTALEGAGYRVLRYDARGHGGTQVTTGPYSLEQFGHDAVGLMDALGIDRVHWVGLSMGGMIGQELALAHAQRLRSLVLADTMAVLPGGADAVWSERIATAREQGMEALVGATLQRWFTPAALAEDSPGVRLIRQYFLATPAEGYIGASEAITRLNYRDRLHRIDRPTLIMVGEQDPGTPVAVAEDLHRRIPGSQLVVIPAASHLSNVEQAEVFNRHLLAFLDART
ncbi:MAG: alpha/beta fold hydrolase, partial [Candidatus Competibacterales bacterium]|nr:alpha/beta fold hydrolase [Candidatus Competibacterales bacterium]